ncbi:fimbria/pilus chaperone family protein [Pantoea sp. GM01]|uniref:fimbria/pilus chaperone family protein n=1 Tax=Pantoea sp. GM01 TaxID=1144320 RepID=UPI00027125CC|nr:fimbria/pilus chaperone family protein [Pantoea sp. GM01]EJL85161.1 P pilus assembly protein, chaperone PapD [Pantoea sp. GM01]
MKFTSMMKNGAASLLLVSGLTFASGMVPETSVVIVEQSDGEGAINVKNTDSFPVLLLTNIINIDDDNETLLSITPPAARVEPGKSQRVRFILTDPTPLKVERLKRVTFEGVPPQQKDKNEVRMTVRQNLPVLIRPAGLAADAAPWKHLTWKQSGNNLTVSNPSPYVVRLGQGVKTLPDNVSWMLPQSYILPNQTLTINPVDNKTAGSAQQVRIAPATTWGFTVESYDAAVTH